MYSLSHQVAPKCFMYLKDTHGNSTGLADINPAWGEITTPDEHGFRGMTTTAPLRLVIANDEYYSPEGVKMNGEFTMASTVVCFESSAAEEGGKLLHSAVDIGGNDFALPPLTLIEVVKVEDGPFEYMPGSEMWHAVVTVLVLAVAVAEILM